MSDFEISLHAYRGNDRDVVIPADAGLDVIGERAFAGNPNLRSVVIPEGVKAIGAGAFKDCTNLTSVIIPELSSISNNFVKELYTQNRRLEKENTALRDKIGRAHV